MEVTHDSIHPMPTNHFEEFTIGDITYAQPMEIQEVPQSTQLAEFPAILILVLCLSPALIAIATMAIFSAVSNFRFNRKVSRLQQIIALERLLSSTPYEP